MSKFVKNEKALKAVMAGAVALTPVIAVGVNVEKVDAATDEDYAKYIKELYEYISVDDRVKLEEAHSELKRVLSEDDNALIKQMLDSSLNTDEQNAAIEIVTSMFDLFSPITVDAEFETKYQKFKDDNEGNVRLLFGSDITADELGDFLMTVHGTYYNLVRNLPTPTTTQAYIGAYGTALASYENSEQHGDIYDSLQGILKGKTAVLDALNTANQDPALKASLDVAIPILVEALREVAPYTPSPNPEPPVIVPGNPAPTPTPENPVVDDKKGQVAATADAVVSNPQSVIDAIKKAEQISTLAVAVKAGEAQIAIPFTIVAALEDKNANATVAVSTEHATYHMPVAEIDAAAVARQLGVATSELKLVVSMEKVANPLASQSTYKVLADAVDFKASLQAPGGKSVELTVFAKPVQRTILSTQTALDPVTTVGVMVGANGAITAVPTYVTEDKKNADLYRAGNSTYTLIENFKTFNDVNNGKNWAEDYIERLASKMVVNGTTATTFEPDRSISRGEFAALLSRGLGLTAQNKTVKFSDVSANQAFNKNGEIASVVEAGIVQGDKNGKFRPYDTITRDEAAIMISRAMDFIDSEYVKLEPGKKVSHFEDYRYIGGTARPHVEKVYQAGYLGGYSNGTFGPANETERAQMAKILYNFLQSIHFIN